MVNKRSPNRSLGKKTSPNSKKFSPQSNTLRSKSSVSGNTLSTNRLGSNVNQAGSIISSYLDLNTPVTLTGSSNHTESYTPDPEVGNFETFAGNNKQTQPKTHREGQYSAQVEKLSIEIHSPNVNSQQSGDWSASNLNYSQSNAKLQPSSTQLSKNMESTV